MLAFAACPDETEELKADFAKVYEAIGEAYTILGNEVFDD